MSNRETKNNIKLEKYLQNQEFKNIKLIHNSYWKQSQTHFTGFTQKRETDDETTILDETIINSAVTAFLDETTYKPFNFYP